MQVAGGAISIRIDLASFILTGNQEIGNPALRDRIPTIRFERVPAYVKIKIIERAWRQYERLTRERFPQATAAEMITIAGRFKQCIIAADAPFAPSGGYPRSSAVFSWGAHLQRV